MTLQQSSGHFKQLERQSVQSSKVIHHFVQSAALLLKGIIDIDGLSRFKLCACVYVCDNTVGLHLSLFCWCCQVHQEISVLALLSILCYLPENMSPKWRGNVNIVQECSAICSGTGKRVLLRRKLWR